MEGDPRAEREYRKREGERVGMQVGDAHMASERKDYFARKSAEQTGRQGMKDFGLRSYLGAVANQAVLLAREVATPEPDQKHDLRRQRLDIADAMPRSADDIQHQEGRNARLSREELLGFAQRRLDKNMSLDGLPDPRKEASPAATRER
jgi:hypothetical protein